ncbi:MAG: polyprenyl synthetase family protein [Turneriella sp.]
MQELLDQHKSRFERDFLLLLGKTSLKSAPKELRAATEYSLSGKNKRLRPILALESARISGMPDNEALAVAAAVECLHTYSLVHDDLPAMDNDDLRRGQASTHKKFGEASAILVGDLLQALSFECLAHSGLPVPAFVYFARAVGAQGMVSGQFLDMLAGDANTYRLHRLKTGRLIEAALMLPLLRDGKKLSLAQIRWARGLGLLFQITDDLLDTTGDTQSLGKTAGKDAAQHKKTIVALLGLNSARQKAQAITQRLAETAPQIFPESLLLKQLPSFLLQRQS